MNHLPSELKSKKKEVIYQVLAYFIAVLFITTVLHSIDQSWGIISIPSSLANIIVRICVIHSCYRLSLFLVKKIFGLLSM
ncbi:Uncharacterised protein [Cedecea lapagei]|uniref:Uncharacterized protein n=1 Tax=Cedecea lapagei TaxID=158823 RepID=A0A3S4K290_9ENTR|nr:Uncharacterised protein [Cedecea lapagei]